MESVSLGKVGKGKRIMANTNRIERLEEEMTRQAEKLNQLQQENERLKKQKEDIPTVSFSSAQN